MVSTTLSKVLLLSFSDLSRSVSCSSPTAGGMRLLLKSSWADGLSEGLSDSSHRMTIATCSKERTDVVHSILIAVQGNREDEPLLPEAGSLIE